MAIGAHYLRQQYALERVAIIDWDVHHGNGTQNSFYRDEHVFFCSIHQAPHYPGVRTGAAGETGQGKGLGSTLNIPVPYGSEDSSYFDIFKRRVGPLHCEHITPTLSSYQLVSMPTGEILGDIRLTTEGFRTLSKMVAEWAGLQSQGRLVSVLEGGYDLEGLCESTQVHLEALIEA